MGRLWLVLTLACCRYGFETPRSDGGLAGDAPDASARCLADDFSSGAIDAGRWLINDPANAVHVNMQQLAITLVANAPSPAYFGVASNQRYDLTAGAVAVELTRAPAAVYGPEAYLELLVDDRNLYLITDSSGNLVTIARTNGTDDRFVAAYDPVAERHWRIRHDAMAAMVVFETSADGVTWTARRSSAAKVAVTALQIQLVAGTYMAVASPGEAWFDNLSMTTPACP